MRPLLLPPIVFALTLPACHVTNDLGVPCQLVKRDPNNPSSNVPVSIKESDITPGLDFISFGAVDCDNLICIRDGATPLSGNPNAPAFGYCSSRCIPGLNNDCAATPGNISDGRKLACRPLLLDPATLAAICGGDGGCPQFGGQAQSDFCAKTDGG